jgi:hypothetical protein
MPKQHTEKEILLGEIIYMMILAEKGMREDHSKYQKIMYELFEASKIIRDSIYPNVNESEEIARAEAKIESLKPELKRFA